MTKIERKEIKAKLIEVGFWGVSEEGDPTADPVAAGILLRSIEKQFAAGFFLHTVFADKEMTARELRVVGFGIDQSIAVGHDVFAAICGGALALPEFLRRHPECAADVQEPVVVEIGEDLEGAKRGASKKSPAKKTAKKKGARAK